MDRMNQEYESDKKTKKTCTTYYRNGSMCTLRDCSDDFWRSENPSPQRLSQTQRV